MARMTETAFLIAADETLKATKKSNDLLQRILDQQAEALAEQRRTNELLAYMADLAYKNAGSTPG